MGLVGLMTEMSMVPFKLLWATRTIIIPNTALLQAHCYFHGPGDRAPVLLPSLYIIGTYRVVQKKVNLVLAAILKYFLEVIIFHVYIFGFFRLFYVSDEEIVEKMQE